VVVVTPGIRVDSTEEGPTNASGDTVINTDLIVIDNIAAGIGRHQRLRRSIRTPALEALREEKENHKLVLDQRLEELTEALEELEEND
jgi:hypothetical protein